MKSGIAGKVDDGVEVIRHEQQEAAVPDKSGVIMAACGQNFVASAGTAEMIATARFAIDGEKKRAGFGYPFRDGMR